MSQGSPWKKGIKLRLSIMAGLFVLVSIGVAFNLFKVQFVEGKEWRMKAENVSTQYREIKAIRGNIYSSDGALLVTSVPKYEIRFDTQADAISKSFFDENVNGLARGLSEIFPEMSYYDIRFQLKQARANKQRYFLVKNNVNFNELQRVKQLPIFNRGRFKGGVIYEKKTKRVKPFGMLAKRTLGFQREGMMGVGIEGAYNDVLSGTKGLRLEQRLAGGVWMPLEANNEIEPEDGLDVVSTIDINIQDVAEEALHKQLKKHGADHGTVVLMEVETGKIRAIANLSRNEDGSYDERYNYAVGEATEPGSTFKLPALLCALDDGYVSLSDTVDALDGKVKYYGHEMSDSKYGGWGKITVKRAFEVSSNVGLSQIILKHYKDKTLEFTDKLRSMGLDKKLGLEINGEGSPLIQDPRSREWSGISLTQMSIGYEVLQTPLQVLSFYNAVANNGVLVKPMLVEAFSKNGEIIETKEPEILNKAIASRAAIKQAQEMLRGVVENGTATNLKDAPFPVAGKTGTARIANESYGYKYDDKYSYQASFVGYFPSDNPKYSCIVVVNAPNSNVYYGNLVAGPIFREVADKVYSTQIRFHESLNEKPSLAANNIPISKDGNWPELKRLYQSLGFEYVSEQKGQESAWVRSYTGEKLVRIKPHPTRMPGSNLMPNVVGMGLKDALYLLENSGLKVQVEGAGVVKFQSLMPGDKIEANQIVKIELS